MTWDDMSFTEKVKAVISGEHPCPDGYEVIKLGDDKFQIWNNIQNSPLCWVDKVENNLEVIC